MHHSSPARWSWLLLLAALHCTAVTADFGTDYIQRVDYQTSSSTVGNNSDSVNRSTSTGSLNGQPTLGGAANQSGSSPGSYHPTSSQGNPPPSGSVKNSPPPTPDSQNDCKVLLAFKSGISNWEEFAVGNNVLGWLQGTSTSPLNCCSWSFIICNSAGRVTSVSLDGSTMEPLPEGFIFPGVAALDQLNNLTIVHTNISGPLPYEQSSSFGNLAQLVVADNSLTGSLPSSWGSGGCLGALQILDVSQNLLSGTLPPTFGRPDAFPHLQALSLADNHLTGQLPDSWSLGWKSLQQLDLSLNLFQGSLPASWGMPTSFPSLWHLRVAGNNLSGPIPDAAWSQQNSWPSLTQLDLSQNHLAGSLPSLLTMNNSMPMLYALSLANNSFKGSFPNSWSQPSMWSQLAKLDVSGNQLSGSLPAAWASAFPELQWLDLSRNNLSGPLPDSWRYSNGAWPQLTTLSLGYNRLTGLPASWANDTGMKHLTMLDLSNNMFTELPTSWGDVGSWDYLRQIFLESNQLSGPLPPSWGNRGAFPLLRTLQIANNNFTGSVPPSWGGLLASVWIKPGNPLLCSQFPTQMAVCEATDVCYPSVIDTCTCTPPPQTNQPCNASLVGPSTGLAPDANAPLGANGQPSDISITLRLTPLQVSNFTTALQQQLVGVLQDLLPLGSSILITMTQDLVTNSGEARRRSLLMESRRLLQADAPLAQSPTASNATAGSFRNDSQTFNSVNVTLTIFAPNSSAAVQAAREMLNVTATGDLLRSLQSQGFEDLISVQLVATAATTIPLPPEPGSLKKLPVPSITPSSGKGTLSAGEIAGLVVAPCIGAICFTALACLVWQRRKKRKQHGSSDQARAAKSKLDSESEPRSSQGLLDHPVRNFTPWALGSDPVSSFTERSGIITRASDGELVLPWSDWEARPEEFVLVTDRNGENWELGRGNFGVVYKGLRNGVTPVAIKFMTNGPMGNLTSLSSERKASYLEEFKREIMILKSCRDKNIVQFIGASLADGGAMLVTEYMEMGDLYRALLRDDKPSRRFSWYHTNAKGEQTVNGLCKRIALDVARGLVFLHSRNIVHLDLKSANILLARDFTAKLTDVGLAKILSKEHISALSGAVGTFAWAAPEILLMRECSEKVDIFSMGVVLWELSTLESPNGRCLREIRVPEEAPQSVVDIITCCISEDPSQRPSALQLVQQLDALR